MFLIKKKTSLNNFIRSSFKVDDFTPNDYDLVD